MRHFVLNLVLVNINFKTNSEIWLVQENIDDAKSIAENEVKQVLHPIGIFGGAEFKLGQKLIVGVEPNIRFAPINMQLYDEVTEAKSLIETGVNLRLRF